LADVKEDNRRLTETLESLSARLAILEKTDTKLHLKRA
jgi:hypothetical protein